MATRYASKGTVFLDSNGHARAGGKLNFYITGTTTPKHTYTVDALTGGLENTNPVVLDGSGRCATDIFLLAADYKVVLTNSDATDSITDDPVHGGSTLVGPVGIGMTAVNILDITQTQNASSVVSVLNASGGAAASSQFSATNGTNAGKLLQFGTSFTPSGVSRADGTMVRADGAGGLTLNTGAAQPIYFAINGVAAGLFTINRALHASIDGTYFDGVGDRHELGQSAASSYTLITTNKHASTPFGVQVVYTGASPNGTGNEFLTCQDGGSTVRASVRSNGGLANFSANNVNLSDITVKPEFQKHTDIELVALEASFVAVDWGKFKYADQTHSDWNYGYSAQGVEAAFAATVPAMTDVWNPETVAEIDDGTGKMVRSTTATPVKDQLRAVYTEDLHNIAHALLARALVRIADLETRLAAAHIP